ncbi:MAG: hypothetical protein HW421_3086 [Ignavibacteria bacterium]|nr:hypothetical protein [Ignavibacteria bacterium]
MDIALQILGIIALVVFIILAVFGIISLSKLVHLTNDIHVSLDNLTRDFAEVNKKFIQALNDISEIKIKLNESLIKIDGLSEELKLQASNVGNELAPVLKATKPIAELLSYAFERIASPMMQTVTLVSAVSKAVNAFINKFSHNKS